MTASSQAASTVDLPESSKRAWLLALVLSMATALAIIWPFFWKGNASGHDFSFHAASWMDAAAQWRDGILLPRWTAGANHGFGEPRFIFYPPLSWMFGAALGFVVPWVYVPAVFIVLTQMMAGLSAFALGRRLFPERGAFLCAVCYAANPYALLIVYMRSDFAEQLALVFFPLLTLATLEVLGLVHAPLGKKPSSIALLAILFAAVWLTNAPAGVVATYSLAVLFAWTAITTKSCRPLIQGGIALALGFGLAGVYLVPAIYEQRWVNITQALASGLQPSQNFLFAVIADTEHNAFNRIASGMAVLMIVLTAIFAALTVPRRDKSRLHPSAKSVWSVLFVLSVTAAFLMLHVSNIFWIALPKLRFVQFPWRWMSILAIPFACFIAMTTSQRRLRWYGSALIVAAVMAALGAAATYMVRHTWWDSEDIPVLQEAIGNDEGFEGVDEYDPVGGDHSILPEKSARATLLRATRNSSAEPDAKVHVESWTAERKELRITAREPLRLSLRLLNYPAWRIEVNDAAVIAQQTAETGQIVVPLAAGSSHVIVRFVRTPDRIIGGVLTGAAIFVVLLLFFRRQ
jgi:6-pyruvoyl-tetrahydropterin synthase related domain